MVAGCGAGGGSSPLPAVVLSTLTVAPNNPAVSLGGQKQMSAVANFSDGSKQDVTQAVTWSSGSKAIATISAQGLITTNAVGQSLITASLSGVSGNVTLTVNDISVKSIQVTPGTPTLFAGAVQQMKATATLADNSLLDITRFVTWSANPGISVNASGLVTTNAAQQAQSTVTATYEATNGNTNVTVTAGPDQLYVFRSPSDQPNANNFGNSDFVVTTSPRQGTLNPSNTFDPNSVFEIDIDNNNDLLPDQIYQVSFAAPVPAGNAFNQVCTLRLIQGNSTTTIATFTYNTSQTIPPVAFANNVTFPGDAIATGKFLAGATDDPAFFDAVGGIQFLQNGGPMPRGNPVDFFGPNGNCLSIVLEAPTTRFTVANPPKLNVWVTHKQAGNQVTRAGQPYFPFFFIDSSQTATFNSTQPGTDAANFAASATARLQQAPFNLTLAKAQAVVATFVPDVLRVDLSSLYTDPNGGFANAKGRRLRDDVVDFLLTQMTNGAVTNDGITDDNGALITDGLSGSAVKYPFVGTPHNQPQ